MADTSKPCLAELSKVVPPEGTVSDAMTAKLSLSRFSTTEGKLAAARLLKVAAKAERTTLTPRQIDKLAHFVAGKPEAAFTGRLSEIRLNSRITGYPFGAWQNKNLMPQQKGFVFARRFVPITKSIRNQSGCAVDTRGVVEGIQGVRLGPPSSHSTPSTFPLASNVCFYTSSGFIENMESLYLDWFKILLIGADTGDDRLPKLNVRYLGKHKEPGAPNTQYHFFVSGEILSPLEEAIRTGAI